MKTLAQIVSVLAILIAVVWFLFEPGFEPVITALFGIAGFVASLRIKGRKKAPEEIEKFRHSLRGIQARWEAEKSLQPVSLDEAKYGIISPLISALTELSASTSDEKLRKGLVGLIQKAKALQYHEIHLDGGKSYGEFWSLGGKLLSEVEKI